jgi:hypothetical protein
MFPFYIDITVDNDFTSGQSLSGRPLPKGVINLHNSNAIIDPNIFNSRIFKPIELILSLDKKISNISQEEFCQIIKHLGYIEDDSLFDGPKVGDTVRFDSDNSYDINYITDKQSKAIRNIIWND